MTLTTGVSIVGWDRGAGAWENIGWEGYRKWQRKGGEAGVLRGQEAGEKCETLIFLIQQCINDNTFKNQESMQNIFDLHLTSSRSLLGLLSKQKFAFGVKNRLTSGQIVNPFTVVMSWVMKCQAP